jgi:glycosyltransferase involved in cell wall biosynthesis
MPSFSVVIPTYNRAALITGTVNSVLAQDYTDYEVVLVDDGSTDNTAEVVLKNYAGEQRVRYIRQANAERGAARNRGLREALGSHVVFFDSDDVMHADHLSALAASIKERPASNFLATKYEIQRDGVSFPSSLAGLKEGFYGLDIFLRGNPLACNICVRKGNPRLHPFVEDRSYAVFEDWMFMAQNLASDQLYLSDRVTISLIDHANRSMRGNNQEIISKNRRACGWIMENVALDEGQKRILDGYSHYFCAIHSYLDGDWKNGLRYLASARRRIGVNKNIAALFVKLMIGQKLLHKASSMIKKI